MASASVAPPSPANPSVIVTTSPEDAASPEAPIDGAAGGAESDRYASLALDTGGSGSTSDAAASRGLRSVDSTTVTAGLNYFFPMVQVQHAVSRTLALGVSGLAVAYSPSSSLSLSGFGGYATLSYFADGAFSGVWYQAGVGAYRLNAKSSTGSSSLTAPAAMASLGWWWKWGPSTHFAFATGINYLSGLAAQGTSNVVPAILLNLGFTLF